MVRVQAHEDMSALHQTLRNAKWSAQEVMPDYSWTQSDRVALELLEKDM